MQDPSPKDMVVNPIPIRRYTTRPAIAVKGLDSSSSTPMALTAKVADAPTSNWAGPGAPPKPTCGSRILRLLNSEKIPVLLDLVEDRTTSRLLNTFLFILVFLFVFRAALFVIFLLNPFPTSVSQLINLTYLNDRQLAGQIGVVISPYVSLQVSANDGSAVSNATVSLQFGLDQADTNVWQSLYGFQDTLYDMHGLTIGGRFKLPGMVPKALLNPALDGTVAVSDSKGYARFKGLRMTLGVPSTYQMKATVNDVLIEAGVIDFAGSVASISVVNGLPPDSQNVFGLNQSLPTIAIKLLDVKGNPVVGKQAIILSAPPSVQEFSSFSGDAILPRYALFTNNTSTESNASGIAIFTNVAVIASSIPNVRALVVADGIIAASQLDFEVSAPSNITLQIVTQPSSTVVEGQQLTQPPAVKVLLKHPGPGNSIVLTPLPGVILMAFPYKINGFRSAGLIDPAGISELNMLLGTQEAILANIGRRKLLFNFTSSPSDATGLAKWSNIGFIQHGPAGNYTLTFALAGFHLESETQDIQVLSSVNSVEHFLDDDNAISYASTICSYPRCNYTFPFSKPYGSILFSSSANDTADLPSALSGGLSTAPMLVVRDANGMPLAGKFALPVIFTDDSLTTLASGISMKEFPFQGATQSVLYSSVDQQDGLIGYEMHNVGLTDADLSLELSSTGTVPSFFRVLTAPAGHNTGLHLVFNVEGTLSNDAPLDIYNADDTASPACATLDVIKVPNKIGLQKGGQAWVDGVFQLKASTLSGAPVVGINVSMYLVDTLGTVLYSDVGGNAAVVTQEYVAYVLRQGGGGAFGLGAEVASVAGVSLSAPSSINTTASDGIATFSTFGLGFGSQTYLRFVFVIADNAQPASNTSCFSQYSLPIPVSSDIMRIDWVNQPPSSGNITCIADGVTPLNIVPDAVLTLADGTTTRPTDIASYFLMATIDEPLLLYPSYLGIGSTVIKPTDLSASAAAPLRVPGDIDTSPLLQSQGERTIPAVIIPSVPSLAGALAHSFMYRSPGTADAFQSLGPADVLFADSNDNLHPGFLRLPELAVSPGRIGTYHIFGFADGVVTDSWTPIVCKDNISTILFNEWTATACPTNNSKVYYDDISSHLVALGDVASLCPIGCSGRGSCACGVCICPPGFDGSSDCNVSYTDDSFNMLYASDSQYSSLYGGLPVVDIREMLESVSAATPTLTDLFPRFLFAANISVGWLNNITELQEVAARRLPNIAFTNLAPPAVRLGDILNQELVADTLDGVSFSPAPQVGYYSVLPVLVDCQLNPIAGAYFTSSQPEEMCGAARVPLISRVTSVGGQSTMDWPSTFQATSAAGDEIDFSSSLDVRLVLHNVPTGCYRFRYVYAPTGQGSLSSRTIANMIASASAVSLGASRPFRVLSPVMSITMVSSPSTRTPFDTVLKVNPVVALRVRPSRTQPAALLADTCSNAPDPLQLLQSGNKNVIKRCPPTPIDGLEVIVTAVNVDTGVEYSLYVEGKTYDCARTEVNEDPELGTVYLASFTNMLFPSFPAVPPESDASVADQLPLGNYQLKFTAYGTSMLAPDIIALTNEADAMAAGALLELPLANVTNVLADGESQNFSVPVFSATVANKSVVPPLYSTLALYSVDQPTTMTSDDSSAMSNCEVAVGMSFDGSSGACVGVPGALVTVDLVGGPLNSNAKLNGQDAIVAANGSAGFFRLAFSQGASGIYCLRVSSPNLQSAEYVYVNATNPISSLGLSYGGQAISTANTIPIQFVQGTTLPNLRVCPLDVAGNSWFVNQTITTKIAFLAKAPPKKTKGSKTVVVPADDYWGYDPVYGNAFDDQPTGLVDTRTLLGIATSFSGGKTGKDGCIDVTSFAFLGFSSSVVVSLIFESGGVETVPLRVQLITLQDAHPVSIQDLRARILIPLGMVIAPFGMNAVFHSSAIRWFISLGALASLACMWAFGGDPFFTGTQSLSSLYPTGDLRYVSTVDTSFAVILALVSIAACVLSVILLWKTRRSCGLKSALSVVHQDPLNGYFDKKLDSAYEYAALLAPRKYECLLTDSGILTPPFIEALTEIYERYIVPAGQYGKHGDWMDFEVRRRKGTCRRIADKAKRAKHSAASLPGMMSIEGHARLCEDLFVAATGISLMSVGNNGLLSLQAFAIVVTHVANMYGVARVGSVIHSFVAPARAMPRTEPLFYPIEGQQLSLTLAGRTMVENAHTPVMMAIADRLRKNVGSRLAIAEELLRIFDGATGEFFHEIADEPPTLCQFIEAYHIRLLQCRSQVVRISGAKKQSVLLKDEAIWSELAAFNYSPKLQYRSLDATTANLTPLAYSALSMGMRDAAKNKTGWLSPEDINIFRCSLGLRALRADCFNVDGDGELPDSQSDFVGSTEGSPKHAYQSQMLNPNLYVDALVKRSREAVLVEEELRDHFHAMGYNDRMRQVGGAMGDKSQRAASTINAPGVIAYLQYLTNKGKTLRNGPSQHPQLAPILKAFSAKQYKQSVVPPTSFFYPQRFLIAFGTSLAGLAIVFMLTTTLGNQLAISVNSMWDSATTAQTNALQQLIGSTQQQAFQNVAFVRAAMQQASASAVQTIGQSTPSSISAAGLAKVADLLKDPSSVATSANSAKTVFNAGTLTQAAEAALLFGQGQSEAGAIPSSVNKALSTMQTTLATLGADPSSTNALSQASGATASSILNDIPSLVPTLLNQVLATVSLDEYADIKDEVVGRAVACSLAAGMIAMAAILFSWMMQFRSLKLNLMNARRGKYALLINFARPSKAPNYIGIQTALTIIAYFLLWGLLAVIFTVLSIDIVRNFIWNQLVAIILSLLGATLLINLSQTILMTRILTTGNRINFRRMYMIADMIYSMLNLFVGAIIAILRVILSILLYLATLSRADTTALPLYAEHLDPPKSSYNAMLFQHMEFSNPLMMTFAYYLLSCTGARRTDAVADRQPEATVRRVRATRARNRWHLAVLLLFNPSLRQHRVRDAEHVAPAFHTKLIAGLWSSGAQAEQEPDNATATNAQRSKVRQSDV